MTREYQLPLPFVLSCWFLYLLSAFSMVYWQCLLEQISDAQAASFALLILASPVVAKLCDSRESERRALRREVRGMFRA